VNALVLAAVLPRDDDITKWIAFAIFIVFPLLARLVRWVMEQTGMAKPAERAQTSAERRRAAEARRAEERDGEDLFRRLARGDVADTDVVRTPPATAPVFVPERRSAEARERSFESSLELETEAAPLSVLGEVSEPAEAAETSLESESAPEPLASLDQTAPALEVAIARRAGFALRPGELRRAMIMSEVLGPPVGERPLRA